MTMYHIATATATSNVSALDFSSIPQTFTHLQLRVWGRGTFNNGGSGLSVILAFNGYSPLYRHRLFGNGSTVGSQIYASSYGSAGSVPDVNADSSIWGANIFEILDYTSATKTKTLRYLGGFDRNGSGDISFGSSLASGGAISNLQLTTDGNWVSGTRIDLYGIASNPIATGA